MSSVRFAGTTSRLCSDVLAYLGLGSNLGDRKKTLRAALDLMEQFAIRLQRLSPLYETEPVDFLDQDWFLNAVAEVETDLTPEELLAAAMEIEQRLGRVRDRAKGPRTIDIDLLLYGDSIVRLPNLDIPHPRMAARRFVLAPLADLAPELRHPETGRTVREMLESAPPAAVRLLDS